MAENETEYEIPMLLRFLYGDAVEVAQRGASQRLLRWCAAYEDWIGERRERRPHSVGPANRAWRELVGQTRKMPWEMRQEDVEAFSGWMQARGLRPRTVNYALGLVEDLYRWCEREGVDAACEPGFNPAKGVERLKVTRYENARLLSRAEVGRLLGLMAEDGCALGKRDHAFMLARLRTGVPLDRLRKLRWGQVEQGQDSAWVRWRAGAAAQRLPGEVWAAILAALERGGRLEGMEAGDYIFAPLKEPLRMGAGEGAEDWAAEKPMESYLLCDSLKLYGCRVGIPEEKLNMVALRNTAIRMWLDEGIDLDDPSRLKEIRAFVDSREKADDIRGRLKRLPQQPPDEPAAREGAAEEANLPVRHPRHYQPGDGFTHGYYALSLPPEEVTQMLEKDIQGIEEEFIGLRLLGRGLFQRQASARDNDELIRLGEAYTLLTSRQAEMVRAEKKLAEMQESNSDADAIKAGLERVGVALGMEGTSRPGPAQDSEGMLMFQPGTRALAEEVAAVRLVLRNAFNLAMEAENSDRYMRLVEVYGRACLSLVKLLKMGGNYGELYIAWFKRVLDTVIEDLTEEWGLRNQ